MDLIDHCLDLTEKRPPSGTTRFIISVGEIVNPQKQSYDWSIPMSLFPDEDVLTKEIETWRGFIDKLPSDEDKAILTKLLNDFYEY